MSKNRTEEALDSIIKNYNLGLFRDALKDNFVYLRENTSAHVFTLMKNKLFNKVLQLVINLKTKILQEHKDSSLLEDSTNVSKISEEISMLDSIISKEISMLNSIYESYKLSNIDLSVLSYESYKLNFEQSKREIMHKLKKKIVQKLYEMKEIKSKLEVSKENFKKYDKIPINQAFQCTFDKIDSIISNIFKLKKEQIIVLKTGKFENIETQIKNIETQINELRSLTSNLYKLIIDNNQLVLKDNNNEFTKIFQKLAKNLFNNVDNELDSFLQSLINYALKISTVNYKHELSNEDVIEILNVFNTNTSINELIKAEKKEALSIIIANNLIECSECKLAQVLEILIKDRDNTSLEEIMKVKGFDVNIKINMHSLLTILMRDDPSKLEPFFEKLISDPKIDINFASPTGRTPLYYAIERNKATIVNKLLENNADVNGQTPDGKMSLLHYAITKGNLDIIDMLLVKSTHINIAKELDILLHPDTRAEDNKIIIIKKLLEHDNFKFNDTNDFIITLTKVLAKFKECSLIVKSIIAKHISNEQFNFEGCDIPQEIENLFEEVRYEKLLSDIKTNDDDCDWSHVAVNELHLGNNPHTVNNNVDFISETFVSGDI